MQTNTEAEIIYSKQNGQDNMDYFKNSCLNQHQLLKFTHCDQLWCVGTEQHKSVKGNNMKLFFPSLSLYTEDLI